MSPTENRQTAKRATAKRLQTTLTSKLASSGSDKSNKEEFKKLDEECNNSVEPANSECTSVSEHFEDAARECASPLSGITATKLMRTLATKKREFFHMRKRLFSQQYALIELFATLKELESRIGASGEDQLGEMRVLSVTQWPAHDLLLLVREDLTPPTDSDLNSLIGFEVLERQREELDSILGEVTAMAEELISRRVALVNFIRDKYKVERLTFSKNQEWKTKNLEIDNETEQIQKHVVDVVTNTRKRVSRIMEIAKIPWIDRETLVKKLEKAHREALVLQNKLQDNVKKYGDTPQNHKQSLISENQKRVNDEENMLRIARARIATLERKLKEVRAEREVLRQKHHELEKFCRQRDLMSEASAKKTTNASKTEEMVVENLIRERNELESRLEELQERAQASERRTRAHLEEQRALCDVLQAKLAAKDRATEARVLELQTRVKELENTLDSVRSRSAQLLKIESQAADLIPPKEREPSEREVEMWIELQELQKALAYAEKTAQQYRDDKANLLQSLSDITHDKYDNSAEGKMTAELLEKEKKIIKLRKTVEEQKEREKVMQKTISAYEQQIMELRLEVNCLRSYNDCQKDMPFQDLQTEVIELQMKLMSLSRERKSLLSMSASRALKLERHERAAEQFVRLTRLRRELANLVAPRGTLRPRQFDDIAHNHVSHSLSELCISAAEQWSALQNACARVVLLEKTIMTQKEQLERESRVRTELDRHRERLQRELLEVKGLTKGHTHVPLLTGLTSQIQPPLQFIQEFLGMKKRRLEENI